MKDGLQKWSNVIYFKSLKSSSMSWYYSQTHFRWILLDEWVTHWIILKWKWGKQRKRKKGKREKRQKKKRRNRICPKDPDAHWAHWLQSAILVISLKRQDLYWARKKTGLPHYILIISPENKNNCDICYHYHYYKPHLHIPIFLEIMFWLLAFVTLVEDPFG